MDPQQPIDTLSSFILEALKTHDPETVKAKASSTEAGRKCGKAAIHRLTTRHSGKEERSTPIQLGDRVTVPHGSGVVVEEEENFLSDLSPFRLGVKVDQPTQEQAETVARFKNKTLFYTIDDNGDLK